MSGARPQDLGLEIVTFQPFRDFEGMPAEKRERNFARAERKFDLMAELGCDLLMVCSNVSPESSAASTAPPRIFTHLGERAAKRGMRVGFEALAWGRHINDYRDAWEVVRRAGHPSVGLVLDSFHILSRKTDLQGDDRGAARPDFSGATGRRADAGNGLPVLEPAFPQFPGPGRLPDARLHDGAASDRL